MCCLVEEGDDDRRASCCQGPDRAGNLLELVILDRPQGPALIHAMLSRLDASLMMDPIADGRPDDVA